MNRTSSLEGMVARDRSGAGNHRGATRQFYLSVGRAIELNQRGSCTPVRSIVSEVLGSKAFLIGADIQR